MLTCAADLDAMNRLGRAMSDPTRSRILLVLLERPGYPGLIAEELDLTRSNVSNHLTCLRGCGLVTAEPEGRQTRYEIADPHLTVALRSLLQVATAMGEDTCPGDPCDLGCNAASTDGADSGGGERATAMAGA